MHLVDAPANDAIQSPRHTILSRAAASSATTRAARSTPAATARTTTAGAASSSATSVAAAGKSAATGEAAVFSALSGKSERLSGHAGIVRITAIIAAHSKHHRKSAGCALRGSACDEKRIAGRGLAKSGCVCADAALIGSIGRRAARAIHVNSGEASASSASATLLAALSAARITTAVARGLRACF